jgi:hypothetical protein
MNRMRESQSLLPDGGREQVRHMKQIVVSATIPYTVEFKRRGFRTVEDLIVWDEAVVAISDVNDREAPVAYRIDPCTPSGAAYEIRSFRGGIWWPVFDESRALRFLRGAAKVR